ncbi:MAG: hypothetical protein GC192_14930 [Bacteroidetes bacterium]|nr:hypothetical protein [Bacteroidota bacterium]
MKASIIFYIGLLLDGLLLATTVSNILLSLPYLQDTSSGLTPYGRLASWAIPLMVAALMLTAFLLKRGGKMLPANILIWIPALPMLVGLLIWGGMAALFILAGK